MTVFMVQTSYSTHKLREGQFSVSNSPNLHVSMWTVGGKWRTRTKPKLTKGEQSANRKTS